MPLEQGGVGIAPGGGRMRPEPPGGEEGPLDVGAEDPRARGRPATISPSAATSRSSGARDQRRQVRGDAGLEQRLAGAGVAVRVGVEEVDAAEAVHLEVDEAGRGDARGRSAEGSP